MNSIKTLVLIAFLGIACSPTQSTDRTNPVPEMPGEVIETSQHPLTVTDIPVPPGWPQNEPVFVFIGSFEVSPGIEWSGIVYRNSATGYCYGYWLNRGATLEQSLYIHGTQVDDVFIMASPQVGRRRTLNCTGQTPSNYVYDTWLSNVEGANLWIDGHEGGDWIDAAAVSPTHHVRVFAGSSIGSANTVIVRTPWVSVYGGAQRDSIGVDPWAHYAYPPSSWQNQALVGSSGDDCLESSVASAGWSNPLDCGTGNDRGSHAGKNGACETLLGNSVCGFNWRSQLSVP